MGTGRNAIIAACLLILSAGAVGQGRKHHQAAPEQREAAARELARFDSPTLTRFADSDEFRRYLGAVLADERARNGWWAYRSKIQFAQLQSPGDEYDAIVPICPDTYPHCAGPAKDEEGQIVVTGSSIAAPSNPSITNNQMRNVEEGDIVKQIDHFLLVLQDGRIFVIDTRGGGGRRLVLTERMNVYTNPESDMWYDEMLVFGDRALITGYSYHDGETELSVFRLDATGRLAREGVFHISSNDYYNSSNYATRLIGDNLVIYTPFEVTDMMQSSFRWPIVRRWAADQSREGSIDPGRPLLNPDQIFRPVRRLEDPTVHTVSVCPLGTVPPGGDLECRTTAFVGPNTSQWYVTETDAFLWTTTRVYRSYNSQECDTPPDFERDFIPGLLYRVPLDGQDPKLVGTRGVPPDQFSLHSTGGEFRALVKDRERYCEDEPDPEASLAYLEFPLERFTATLGDLGRDRYAPLPGVKSHYIANRFTDDYLVYGSLGRFRRGLPERSIPPAYAVPAGRAGDVLKLDIRHTVVRAEQAGNDIVLIGYRDLEGLQVTVIDLDAKPRISASVTLQERFESEGRSHAFNSLIEPDGSGLMGLPTIGNVGWSSRAAWRSSASDLSFLKIDSRGRLRPMGELRRRFDYGTEDDEDEDGIPGYSCEVSCIDWYGNSRPIFTEGRVFALTGTELIEGRVGADYIFEVQRINITLPKSDRTAERTGK